MNPTDNCLPLEIRRVTNGTGKGSAGEHNHFSPPSETPPGRGLEICWSNGETVFLGGKHLRTHCPCADCRGKRSAESETKSQAGRRSGLHVVSATIEEETNLTQVWSIGNYAIGLKWGDGHDSGIYTYELLRRLSAESKEGKTL